MIPKSRFALNRVVAPRLGLGAFLDLALAAGFTKVELRNDLAGLDVADGLAPEAAAALLRQKGVEVVTINAVQKFNLPAARGAALAELRRLVGLSGAFGCPALVLCPNNVPDDGRDPATRHADLVASLRAMAPVLEAAGMRGLIEPLGFAISSLASLAEARRAIVESGSGVFGLVHDSFHHCIGPETAGLYADPAMVEALGLVHISGVEDGLPPSAYLDGHRVLVGPGDRTGARDQVRLLEAKGYQGLYSFEPFGPAVQDLPPGELASALRESLAYVAT